MIPAEHEKLESKTKISFGFCFKVTPTISVEKRLFLQSYMLQTAYFCLSLQSDSLLYDAACTFNRRRVWKKHASWKSYVFLTEQPSFGLQSTGDRLFGATNHPSVSDQPIWLWHLPEDHNSLTVLFGAGGIMVQEFCPVLQFQFRQFHSHSFW